MSVRSLVAIVAVVLVACGSDPVGEGTPAPSIPGSSTTSAPGPTTSTTVASTIDAAPTTAASAPSTTHADGGPPTTDPDQSPPTTGSPTTTSRPTETTAPVGGGDELAAASEAFLTWVGHLAEGDHQAAWEAMAPTSRAAVGEGPFFDHLVYAMAEGWGSWAVGENVEFRLEEDQNGRTLLWVSGTIRPEGMVEDREVAVPVVESDGGYLVSPFEEFGNVAEAVEEELEGTDPPPIPADSGTGRRVVYSNSDQRVWLVAADGSIVDSYLVSGKEGVPEPGEYEVYSRSEVAYAGHDDITMRYMVRFAHGENLPIGFHSIPHDANGAPLQSEEQLGEYRSAGCVRQSPAHAAALYEWASEGTTVVVLA